jgi:hypothetical protein
LEGSSRTEDGGIRIDHSSSPVKAQIYYNEAWHEFIAFDALPALTSHKGDKDGYPKISRMIDGVQKHFRLSRYLWAKRNGEIPKGKYLLHSCDNPKCINLEHLRVGTPQDNSSDAVKRGRINKGTDVSISKLSEANVREIKRLLDTETNTQLASKYDVGKTTIWLIRNGKTWKHIKLKESL